MTDSDGVQNSTQATLLVNKATDYKPVANAGPNQVGTTLTGTLLLPWGGGTAFREAHAYDGY